jgi:acetolactate synthase-1/2/3 large subunit
MNVAEYLVEWLRRQRIEIVFDLPGGMISPLLDALARAGGVRCITMHHEQGAAFAADAVGRLTGRPAVALATVGPGAINLLSGIASCYFDSSPALFLTGQVQTYLQKGARPVRQLGFQECDVVAMAAPVAKAAWRVRTAAEVPELLDRALAVATGGRPGPVLLDLPMDVQSAEIPAAAGCATGMEPGAPPAGSRPMAEAALEAVGAGERAAQAGWLRQPEQRARVAAMLDVLQRAERPLVLAGGGVRAALASGLLRSLVRRLGVPVVTSIMALDALPAADPLRVGMIGMYGNRWANLALLESDAILVLGSRLDPGQTSADVAAWRRGRQILQVDCDPAEIGLRVRGASTLQADLHAFLELAVELAALPAAAPRPALAAWRERIAELRAAWPDTAELAGCDGINPNVLVRQLAAASAAALAYTVDAGQHTWWAAQSIQLNAGQRFLAATGLGPMGFALPAGIGVAVATGRPVVVLAGDAALQINIQELQTIVRHRLPVKIVVLNNRCHGMVRQFQESAFAGRYPATVDGYSAPDFARVAAAYGIAGRTAAAAEEVEAALAWLWREPAAPALLEVLLPVATNVYPIVPFGMPLGEMESFRRR